MSRPKNECRNCRHTWFPRGHERSAECPNCKGRSVSVVAPTPMPWGMIALGLVVLVGAGAVILQPGLLGALRGAAAPPSVNEPVHETPAVLPPANTSASAVDPPVAEPVAEPVKAAADAEHTAAAEADRRKQEEAAKLAALQREAELRAQQERDRLAKIEQEANAALQLARNFENSKMEQQAFTKYRAVIDAYPDTAAAKEATARIEAIQQAIRERGKK